MERAAFWSELAAARRAGRPSCWRRPLGDTAARSPEALDWLLAAARAEQLAGRRVPMRIFAHGQPVSPEPKHQPRATDRDMAGYLGRHDALLGGDCGVIINDIQAACPAAWHAMQRLLAELYGAVGLPTGGASVEVPAAG